MSDIGFWKKGRMIAVIIIDLDVERYYKKGTRTDAKGSGLCEKNCEGQAPDKSS